MRKPKPQTHKINFTDYDPHKGYVKDKQGRVLRFGRNSYEKALNYKINLKEGFYVDEADDTGPDAWFYLPRLRQLIANGILQVYKDGEKRYGLLHEFMKPFTVDKNHEGLAYWYEDSEGNVLHINDNSCCQNYHVDLYNHLYGSDPRTPDIQQWVATGIMKRCSSIDCIDFYPKKSGEEAIAEAQAFFKEKGYDVTEEALRHNLFAWGGDFKSGYRDDEHGYHLFTPCGCNPLSFRLETLHPALTGHQFTYIA